MKNLDVTDNKCQLIDEALKRYVQNKILGMTGVSDSTLSNVFNVEIKHQSVISGNDGNKSYLYTYKMIMILYVSIMTYSQLVVNNIVKERSAI